MKKLLFGLICLLTSSLSAAADIEGYWKTINETNGKPECVVVIYPYKKDYYGRMIGSFDDKGVMDDTFVNPEKRATALPGQPYYSGMDFIWALTKRGSVYKGEILNPENGKVYKAEAWIDKGNLVVRGKLMMMGRNQTWLPAQKSDFPPGFQMPDVTKFIPVAPVDELTPHIQ